jgi:hypothetical protein
MSKFPTPIEDIVLNIAFDLMGESRVDRTHKEYMEIAARLPPLKVLHGQINDRLREMAAAGIAPYEICPFKKGDQHIWHKSFPTSVSLEAVRSAMTKVGMRNRRHQKNAAK